MSTLPLLQRKKIPLGRLAPFAVRDTLVVCQRLFVAWLVLRTVAWTLVALAQPNPPLDVIEWVAWGRHWELGYHKHPPLAAWAADLAVRLTPGSFLGVYAMSYLAVAVALWCVWNLGRQILPPRAALAATLCLDGLVFLGPAAAEFNNQVLLIACWALAIERFHAAVVHDRWRDWAITGIALGLGLLCKYSIALLILPLLAWWLWWSRHDLLRLRTWTRPVVVALAAGLIFLPHAWWLVEHNFPTLRYAADRAAGHGQMPDPRVTALVFLLTQMARLIPVGLILLAVLRWRRRAWDPDQARSASLLMAAVVGPVVLHLAAGCVGVQMRDIWGAPLWTFVGLLLVVTLQTDHSGRGWSRLRLSWAIVGGGLLLVTLAGNVGGSVLRTRPLRVHYPGTHLAEEVSALYQQRFGSPPAVVAGDWWLAGNIACHAPHHPVLYGSREPAYVGLDLARDRGDPRRFVSPDPRNSPWTSDDEMLQAGGVLVWDAAVYGDDLPPWLHDRFPSARGQRALVFGYLGGSASKLRVGWAMLPPR
ncbi:MAG: glycosyltransferase family 39 protein [Gemmataceae bacterium]